MTFWSWISRFGAAICFCVVACHCSNAQQTDPQNTFAIQTDTLGNDSIVSNGFFELFKGKPGRAALYGLVIPGGGQVYNHRWWKVPIAIGIDATTIYFTITNTRKLNQSQANYENAVATNDPLKSRFLAIRNNDRRNKEWSVFWLVAGHLFTVMDAFVDRHLMGFDISDDISYQSSAIPVMPLVSVGIPLDYLMGNSDIHLSKCKK